MILRDGTPEDVSRETQTHFKFGHPRRRKFYYARRE